MIMHGNVLYDNITPYLPNYFQLFSCQSSTKEENSEKNLLPITDKSIPIIKPSDKDLKSEKSDEQQPEIKIARTISSNVPATVSSVDQIGISSVDLNIAEAVEKGISDIKKEDPSTSPDVPEVNKNIQTESKCCECENEKAFGNEKTKDVSPKEVVSEVQKGMYT